MERAARVVRARGVGRRAVLTGGSCRTHRAQLVVERRDAVVHTVHRPELGRRRGHAGRRRAARHLREARGARRACCSLSRGSGGAGGGGGGRGGGRDDHGRLWGARAVRHDARASGGHVRRRLWRRQRHARHFEAAGGWKGARLIFFFFFFMAENNCFLLLLLHVGKDYVAFSILCLVLAHSRDGPARAHSSITLHSLKVPSHDQPRAIEVEREGEGVKREYGCDGVDEVLAPG